MADVEILFNGGPCNGTDRIITQDQLAGGALTCQGVTYRYDEYATRTSELIVFSTASKLNAEAQLGGAFHPEAAAAAWSRFVRSLAHTAPRQIRRQHAANVRLRRIGR